MKKKTGCLELLLKMLLEPLGKKLPLAEPTNVSKEAPGNFHILPIDQSADTTQSNGIIGGPGPVLVPNPGEIKEFTEIRDVDARELNERLNKRRGSRTRCWRYC
ncbi:CNT_collapsed_G0024250.mRNA.1.CDS.1 [Saccharomyces cerevisiae]|nr:CNT_collapsed_G0024250.mRNA.1.CDS.1 [Saccharomyces cerevisiae]